MNTTIQTIFLLVCKIKAMLQLIFYDTRWKKSNLQQIHFHIYANVIAMLVQLCLLSRAFER